MIWYNFLTSWYGIFGFIWALPVSFLSFIFSTMWLLIFRQVRFKGRFGWIFEFEAIRGNLFDNVWGKKWAGYSAGCVVVYSSSTSDWEPTIVHERRHSWQVFVFGIFQPITYFVHYVYNFCRTRDWFDSYYGNIWEIDARREEAVIRSRMEVRDEA